MIFHICGYILKTKYKNMEIFANFFFPLLVIKILHTHAFLFVVIFFSPEKSEFHLGTKDL
jgi:hypothetical protein